MQLGSPFSDGIVLQRDKRIAIWGTDQPPYCKFRCQLMDTSAFTLSGADGKFLFHLPPMPWGGPFELTVTNLNTSEEITLHHVMIGEVWVASGQSNMHYELAQFNTWEGCEAGENGLTRKFPREFHEFHDRNTNPGCLRMLTVPRLASGARESSFQAAWKGADRDNSASFSAVAAWFGLTLQQQLGIPVGIINASWGGSIIEAWTSLNTLLENPDMKETLEQYENALLNHELWEKINPANLETPPTIMEQSAELTPDTGNTGLLKHWTDPEFDDAKWPEFTVPGSWIARNMAGNGIVWLRVKIQLPEAFTKQDLRLNLGYIDKQDITYFNGAEIGRTGKDFETSFWNRKRCYSIPAKLLHPGVNTIAVRARSFICDGAFGSDKNDYFLETMDGQQKLLLPEKWKFAVEQELGLIKNLIRQLPPGPANYNSPHILFDAMIRPLLPFTIRGVIWYQGESNAMTMDAAHCYQNKMTDMIRDWRFHWECGAFPFILTQLANYHEFAEFDPQSKWAVLREAQRQTTLQMQNTGMAVTIDAGEHNEVHPRRKRIVGERLAAWALHHVYKQNKTVPEGPRCLKAALEKDGIRIFFNAYGKLTSRDGKCKSLQGFYVTDEKKTVKPVSAQIEDNTVFLTLPPDCISPVEVCYAWSDNPAPELFNDAAFPASPFKIKICRCSSKSR